MSTEKIEFDLFGIKLSTFAHRMTCRNITEMVAFAEQCDKANIAQYIASVSYDFSAHITTRFDWAELEKAIVKIAKQTLTEFRIGGLRFDWAELEKAIVKIAKQTLTEFRIGGLFYLSGIFGKNTR